MGLYRFAERQTNLASPQRLDSSKNVPLNIQSRVSDDPTFRWNVSTHTLPDRNSLKKIQMLNGTDGWMSAYPTGLYRTFNAGETWEPIALDLQQRTYVTDIFFATSKVGWVAVSRTESDFDPTKGKDNNDDATWIMETTDGGKKWRERLSLEGAQITQIHFVANNEGWATGRRFGKAPTSDTNLILHTNDSGRNWTDISGKLPTSGAGVDQFHAIGPSRALLLTLSGFVYSTTDGGQSWHQDDVFRDRHEQTAIHRIGVTGDGQLWLLGGTSGLEGTWSILAFENKDTNWARYEIGGMDLSDAVFLSQDQVLACGSISPDKSESTRQGVILYSTDQGKNWVIVYRDRLSPGLNALTVIDSESKHILAVGERGLIVQIDSP